MCSKTALNCLSLAVIRHKRRTASSTWKRSEVIVVKLVSVAYPSIHRYAILISTAPCNACNACNDLSSFSNELQHVL